MYIPDGSNQDYGMYNSGVLNEVSRDDSLRNLAHDMVFYKADSKEKLFKNREFNKYESRYFTLHGLDNIYMWGWLGNVVHDKYDLESHNALRNFSKMKKLVKKLKSITHDQTVDHYKGGHTCEMCEKAYFGGSVKIAYKDKIYCCPYGVEHYIEIHHYLPPEDAIEAVFHGEILTGKDLLKMAFEKYEPRIMELYAMEKEKREKEIEEGKFQARKSAEMHNVFLKSLSPDARKVYDKFKSGKLDIIPIN